MDSIKNMTKEEKRTAIVGAGIAVATMLTAVTLTTYLNKKNKK